MAVDVVQTLGESYHSYICVQCLCKLLLSFSVSVQLLHKLSIHADDGPMKLMKVTHTIFLNFMMEFEWQL